MKIELDISNCDDCPKAKISKVYTSDSWDDVRQIICGKTEEVIYKYLDWNDKSPIPLKCPLRSTK